MVIICSSGEIDQKQTLNDRRKRLGKREGVFTVRCGTTGGTGRKSRRRRFGCGVEGEREGRVCRGLSSVSRKKEERSREGEGEGEKRAHRDIK